MNVSRWSWVPLGIAGSVVAGAQGIAPATQPVPPIFQVQTHDQAGPGGGMPIAPRPTMTIWRAGAATCGGQHVPVTRAIDPLPTLGRAGVRETPVRVLFRIDAGGRPLGIRREGRPYGAGADLLPALAAARFSAGTGRNDCAVAFTPDRLPLDRVPEDMAMAYTLFPTGPRAPEALWRRIRPSDATCFRPVPVLLNRAYPDFAAIPGEQGRPLWSMVGYDIDAGGRPVRVRTVNGSRSPALDAAARRAVAQSRFGKGARRGCLYPYRKIADPMPAPEPPARADASAQPEACTALGAWVRAPRPVYPTDYRRRGIEGWAIVSYDVAPWGALGNVKVVAAEPTSDFGEAARRMFTGLGRRPSATGASGCLDQVRYVMGKPDTPSPDEAGQLTLYE